MGERGVNLSRFKWTYESLNQFVRLKIPENPSNDLFDLDLKKYKDVGDVGISEIGILEFRNFWNFGLGELGDLPF